MRYFPLEKQAGDAFISGTKQQTFRMRIEPANSMCAIGKSKIKIAKQANLVKYR
jgi:hypothetical protein